MPMDVFITGGTGYIGRRLSAVLLARGHGVRVLTRAASAPRVVGGAISVIGDALDAASFAAGLRPRDTLVHLVGTPHPSQPHPRALDVAIVDQRHERSGQRRSCRDIDEPAPLGLEST